MWLNTFLSYPIIQIVLVLIAAILLNKISGYLVNQFVKGAMRIHAGEHTMTYKKRVDTVSHIFEAAVGVVIWIIAAIAILRILNVNLASIATGAGFLGIVIGLGAQTTIKDFLAGMFILIENQYRVGDIITLSGGSTGADTSGVVEEITLRITKLRDLNGSLHIIRNGEASVITNLTFDYSSVVIDIGVAYDTDIDVAERVMNEIGNSMKESEKYATSIDEPIQFLRVDRFADSAVILKALGKVKPAMQWEIAGEYRRRILKEFAKADIEIPFPQVVVRQKQIKKSDHIK